MKLFNAIQQAQAQSEAVTEQKKAQRGTGKQTLAAPAVPMPAKGKTKAKNKDNIIGRGKDGEYASCVAQSSAESIRSCRRKGQVLRSHQVWGYCFQGVSRCNVFMYFFPHALRLLRVMPPILQAPTPM